jgi:hypothetical protein
LGAVIDQVKATGQAVIPGDEAFKLKDTDGHVCGCRWF